MINSFSYKQELYNNLHYLSLLQIYRKKKLPMNDSTLAENEMSKIVEMGKRQEGASEDTMFFLRLFARVYEPRLTVSA